MATQKIPTKSNLNIQVQTGTNTNGLPILVNRSYSGVKVDATNEDVMAVGQAIAAVQSLPVMAYQRVDYAELLNM